VDVTIREIRVGASDTGAVVTPVSKDTNVCVVEGISTGVHRFYLNAPGYKEKKQDYNVQKQSGEVTVSAAMVPET
jgi:hypothetical protein